MSGIFIRSDGSSWIFVSGLNLGLAGNIAVSALSPESLPGNWVRLLVAAGLLALSSGMFASVGWLLQRLDSMARDSSVGGLDDAVAVKTRLVRATRVRTYGLLLVGLGCAVGGFGVLAAR